MRLAGDPAVPGVRRGVVVPAVCSIAALGAAFSRLEGDEQVTPAFLVTRGEVGLQGVERLHFVHSGEPDRGSRIVRRQQRSLDGCARCVLLGKVERALLRRAVDQEHRLRDADAGEMEEFVRLAEDRGGVHRGGGLHHRDRSGPNPLGDFEPTRGEFLFRKGRREWPSRLRQPR